MPRAAVVICRPPRASTNLSTLIGRLAAQALRPAEVIVIGSSDEDDLNLWRQSFDMRVVAIDDDRLSVQRNLGWRAATADLVAFFDDDALPDLRWFEQVTRVFIEQAGSCAACGGMTIDETQPQRPLVFRNGFVTAAGQLEPVCLEPDSTSKNRFNVLDRANMLCSRRALSEIGGFDEAFESQWCDFDLCCRLARGGYRVVHHMRGPVHLLRRRDMTLDAGARLATAARDRTYFVRKLAEKSDWESALSMLLAGREQRRALGRSGVSALVRRRMARVWASGVRAGLALPLPAATSAVEPTTANLARAAPTLVTEVARPTFQKRWQIALVCGVFEAGHNGISEYTRLLAESFSARGHGVTVFRTNKAAPLSEARPYRVVEVEPRRGELYQAAVGRYVLQLHRQSGVDLVEAPVWLGEACGVGLLAPYPVITRLVTPADVLHRNSQVSLAGERANQNSMERLQLAISQGVIGISQAVCQTVEEVFGTSLSQPGRPLAVIPLGLPSAETLAMAPCKLPSNQRPAILYVGRLHQRKGILDLGQAFARLAKSESQAQLWIVGRDYSDYDGFREQTGASCVEAFRNVLPGDAGRRTHLLGEVSDAEKNFLISQADIVVVPSWYESFGLVLLEAMRLGKPVVACAAGGMREIVVDRQTGLLVPPQDPGRLAEALWQLCHDAGLRRAFGTAAAERFERHYRLDRCVDRTEAFYGEVIDAARTIDLPTAFRGG